MSAHHAATMAKSDALATIQATNKEQVRCHTDSNRDIDGRVSDIKNWIQKLNDELKLNVAQSHELFELKERLESIIKVQRKGTNHQFVL